MGTSMAINRAAEAYATQFCPIFIGRYIEAARTGRSYIIPEPIRDSIVAYAQGIRPQASIDANAWMRQTLYNYRVQHGSDYPLP